VGTGFSDKIMLKLQAAKKIVRLNLEGRNTDLF
jgi:hypothetical protein